MPRVAGLILITLLAATPWAEAQRGAPPPDAATVTCESRGNEERFCPADTRGGVVLAEVLGGRCTLGRTWGYEADGIWVRGCSGVFALEGRAAPGRGPAPSASVACASEDYRYTLCPADTRGGVRLANQLSRAGCFEGRTWGYDRRGVWVDEGCAAEFELLGAGPVEAVAPGSDTLLGSTFVCESRDGRRRLCPVELDGYAATVVRNISAEPCEEGRNWGHGARGVWVDRGCRAEFRIIQHAAGAAAALPGEELTTIVCESRGFGRRICPIERARSVRLTRELSDTPCEQGDTWGYDRRAVWVDRGCAGEFTLYR